MEEKYKIRKATPRLPAIDLLPVVSHRGKNLDVAIFGPDTYIKNQEVMPKGYFHSKEMPKIFFRPAITSESISIAGDGFGEEGEFDAERLFFTQEGFR